MIFIQWKWFKIWNNFGTEFVLEGVEAAYFARTIFIFYSYLKSCVWLLLEAVTLPITSVSCEWSFSKMELLKKFPRNSMTSERLGNVHLSGVSRVWEAWHMPWAPLWQVAETAGRIKIFICSSSNLYFAPHAFMYAFMYLCNACIYVMHLRNALHAFM